MKEEEFDDRLSKIKSVEAAGDFTGALESYYTLQDCDLNDLQLAATLIGTAVTMLHMNDFASALHTLAKTDCLKLEDGITAISLNTKAHVLTRLGSFTEAMRCAEQAATLAGGLGNDANAIRAEALARQGIAAAELGEFQRANELFEQSESIGLSGELLLAAYLYRAFANEKIGRWNDALAVLTAYSKMDRHPPGEYYQRVGMIQWHLGQTGNAAVSLKHASELYRTGGPQWCEVNRLIGQLNRSHG